MKSDEKGGWALGEDAAEYAEWSELADGAREGRRWKTERNVAVKEVGFEGSGGAEGGC